MCAHLRSGPLLYDFFVDSTAQSAVLYYGNTASVRPLRTSAAGCCEKCRSEGCPGEYTEKEIDQVSDKLQTQRTRSALHGRSSYRRDSRVVVHVNFRAKYTQNGPLALRPGDATPTVPEYCMIAGFGQHNNINSVTDLLTAFLCVAV